MACHVTPCFCPSTCRTPPPPLTPQERQDVAAAEEAARAARLERLRALVAPEVEADPQRLLAPTVASAQVGDCMCVLGYRWVYTEMAWWRRRWRWTRRGCWRPPWRPRRLGRGGNRVGGGMGASGCRTAMASQFVVRDAATAGTHPCVRCGGLRHGTAGMWPCEVHGYGRLWRRRWPRTRKGCWHPPWRPRRLGRGGNRVDGRMMGKHGLVVAQQAPTDPQLMWPHCLPSCWRGAYSGLGSHFPCAVSFWSV